MDKLSGFIFLCNGKTKPECYMYRVFGLPEGKKEVVEKIKPGMELFLFDFELKLLYGPYIATSAGKLNVEPAAFGGKFPAQVSFRICQDCFPLPESSFKHAIQDNYQKGKFKQELNNQQVRVLLSLFRPLIMPTSAHVLPTLPSAARPLPARENQFQPKATLPSLKDPYVAAMQLSHISSVLKSQHTPQMVQGQQYAYCGSSTHGYLSRKLQHTTVPTESLVEDPYVARMQHSYVPQVLATQLIERRILPSQPASYGNMVNMGYAHQAMEPQTLPAPTSSHHSTDVEQMYSLGNPYHSYWPRGEFSSNQYLGSANEQYQLVSQKQEFVMHQENDVQNYGLYLLATARTIQPSQSDTEASTSGQAVGNILVPTSYPYPMLRSLQRII